MRAGRGGGRRWLLYCETLVVALCVIGGHAGGGEAADLAGTFSGEIKAANDQLSVDRVRLGFTLRGQNWHASLLATATEGEFSYLGFSNDHQLGPLSLRFLLVFDPSQSTFTYFSNLARFSLFDLRFANYVYLPAQQKRAYDQITVDGMARDVRWRSDLRVGLCTGEFRTMTLRADRTWLECNLDLSGVLSFNKDIGFERFRLSATRREVPYLTFGSLITDFSLTIDFTLDEKSVSPQLRTRTAQSSFCLTPLLALTVKANPFAIEGIEVYGVKLEASLGDQVEFFGATTFTDAKQLELIGRADYFEIYRVRVRRAACCGRDSHMELAVYFNETPRQIFDWGMTTASVNLPLGERIRFSLALEYPASADWVLRIGWDTQF